MTNQRPARAVPRQVCLSDIEERPDVFQFRHFVVDPLHVDALAETPKGGLALDPLTLWRDEAGGLVVVDGHHRLAAYEQAGWTKKVPVRIHECSLDEARLLALRENGKARLNLTQAEKSDAAWALVCLDRTAYSKRIIMRETGVKDATVARMRRTRKALLEIDPDAELPRRWQRAMAMLKGWERREYTPEEWADVIEAKTEKLDKVIGKALGDMAEKQIEAAAAVVAKRLGRQGLRFLFDEYRGQFGDEFAYYEDDGDF